ncbi:MAG TPA: cardiolipin synthase ClsB [Burkholderiaceae bacterium]|nr:cardiolipin synthase ClsB [Burkholderiaceae bacterium]
MRTVSFTGNNQITLLQSGAQFFPSLIDAIDRACHEIFLETYIFTLDATGVLVRDALQRAARRGVAVYVVVDWLGTGRATCNLLRQQLGAAGVHFRSFNPWFRRGVARTHRKICVTDRDYAFVGGLNINDDMVSDRNPKVALPAPRWDFAIRISGTLVATIYLEMTAQWTRLGNMKLLARWENFRRSRALLQPAGGGPAQAGLVLRDNLRDRRTIQRAYLQALGRAHRNALLATPYFAPGRKLRRALEAAAQRGVKVTLLLGVGQFRLQDAIAHSFYPKLLACGVRIFEYRKTDLHAKVAVVDDEWATVGSSNYDGLSLFVNHEANVVVQDHAFAEELRRQIESAVAQAVPIRRAEFAHIRWSRRLRNGAVFLLYRALIRLVSWGRYD